MKFVLKCGLITQDLGEHVDNDLLFETCSIFDETYEVYLQVYDDNSNLLASREVFYNDATDLVIRIRELIDVFQRNTGHRPGLFSLLEDSTFALNDRDFTEPEILESLYKDFGKSTDSLKSFNQNLYLVYPSHNIEEITISNMHPADVTCGKDFNNLKIKIELFNRFAEHSESTDGILVISKFGEEFCGSEKALKSLIDDLCKKNYRGGDVSFTIDVLHFLDSKLNYIARHEVQCEGAHCGFVQPNFCDNFRCTDPLELTVNYDSTNAKSDKSGKLQSIVSGIFTVFLSCFAASGCSSVLLNLVGAFTPAKLMLLLNFFCFNPMLISCIINYLLERKGLSKQRKRLLTKRKSAYRKYLVIGFVIIVILARVLCYSNLNMFYVLLYVLFFSCLCLFI